MENDKLDRIDKALSIYNHAWKVQSPRAIDAQRLNIEQNSTKWIAYLLQEVKAYRRIFPTAATAGAINALYSELPPMRLIYVCSPLAGNIKKNITAAQQYCFKIIRIGYIPIAPHVMFAGILNDTVPEQRNIGLNIGLELLRFCSEVWVFGAKVSSGMRGEIERAKTLKIPVRRMNGI